MEDSPRHFPEIQLTFVESRVLGCLLEKESTTPAYYPLTLNSLQAACNQTSNRQPVTQLEERLIEKALFGLREKGLVLKVNAAGSRSPKYKHILDQVLDLDSAQRATLTVLLLRGVQTSGEIKQRCERMHEFESLEEVDQALEWFIDYPHGPLVVRNPAGGGRRVETYAHLLGGAVPENARALPEAAAEVLELEEEQLWRSRMEQKIQELQSQVEELSGMVHHLRSELGGE
jgi:uncharacterized protein YceH (UPF0502 family)